MTRSPLVTVALVIAAASAFSGCGLGPSADDTGDAPRSAADRSKRGSGTVTLVAAGDIACEPGADVERDKCRQADTAMLVQKLDPDAVLVLGDMQYAEGGLDDYERSFDRSWGTFRAKIHPTPGNHEYRSEDAKGYFDYFGTAAGPVSDDGYYSFDVGSWHVISLNSNCGSVDVCRDGSAQLRWLRNDLTRNEKTCTLAFWHHPRFSSGRRHGDEPELETIWRTLDEAGVDVALTAHEHNYERFAPQDAYGERNDAGIREFVVGTGGSGFYGFGPERPNSQARGSDVFGVLELGLGSRGYDWQFVPVPDGSEYSDAGSDACV